MSFRKICVDPSASFTLKVRSRYIPRCHLKWTVCMISIVVSCHRCGHKHLQSFRRRLSENTSSGPCCVSLSLALQSRTAFLSLHLVHQLHFERLVTVVVALFLIDNFGYTHLPHVLHFFFASFHQQLRGKSMCRRFPIFPSSSVGGNHLHPAPDLQNAILQL